VGLIGVLISERRFSAYVAIDGIADVLLPLSNREPERRCFQASRIAQSIATQHISCPA
jgi:hypothetical protein